MKVLFVDNCCHQMFGGFSGRAVLDDGTCLLYTSFLYLPQCKACGLYRGNHLILAGVDDAAGQKGSMLCQQRRYVRHQVDDGIGHDVGADDVVYTRGLFGKVCLLYTSRCV